MVFLENAKESRPGCGRTPLLIYSFYTKKFGTPAFWCSIVCSCMVHVQFHIFFFQGQHLPSGAKKQTIQNSSLDKDSENVEC